MPKPYPFIIFLFLCNCTSLFSQSLQPDSSYGQNGVALFPDIRVGVPAARVASFIQPDGKTVVAANTTNPLTSKPAFVTVRFTASGLADSTFGNNGSAITTVSPGFQFATSAVLRPDNKIVTGGYASYTNNELAFTLVRYLPNGGIDSSFGNNGISIQNFRNGRDESLQGMSQQEDGKILACGYTFDPASEIIVARYHANGTPDSSFNGNGSLFLSLTPSSYQAANTIMQLPDGKIVVGGVYSGIIASGNYTSVLIRLHNNGRIDSSFGINGIASTTSSETFIDLKRRLDGRILALGLRSLVCYTPEGKPDMNFGNGNGEITITTTTLLRTMQLLSDGSIWITGSNNTDFVLYKITRDGKMDNRFGINGQQNFRPGSYRGGSYSILQRAGRIYLSGSIETGPGANGRIIVLKLLAPNVYGQPYFRIFPNPSIGPLYIETDTNLLFMCLYNSSGQLIYRWNNNERTLDLSAFAAGIYFLKVTFENGITQTYKIVKAG